MSRSLIFAVLILFFTFNCKNKTDEVLATIKSPPTSKFSCAPQITDVEWYKKENIAPLFEGLGELTYKITTKDSLVQRYFDQGLVLAYGFNHAEAARSFYYATKLDPDCGMCYWGYAYVLGPNYNAGMEDHHYQRAYEAILKAVELSSKATEKEKGLIKAMAERYVATPPEDRANLDKAYSKAMGELYQRFPHDSEIATLYAESLMNLHKWDLNEKDGTEKKWTPEIVALLEKILNENLNHPGANHFYIHSVEASSSPERGNRSAKLFDEGAVPNAGHLLHMPSHIYIRTGDYHKGTISNINAIKADSTYITVCHAQGVYPLSYYPHNYHFMAATAALEGNRHWAMLGANKVSEYVHPDIMKEPGWGTLQHYYVIPYYSMVKFGMWDEILEKKETSQLKYPQAMQSYARGMAHLGQNNIAAAKLESKKLKSFTVDSTLHNITIWDINNVGDLIDIADKVLDAEILAATKNYTESIDLFQEAVSIEDGLNYNEPPDWFFSVRHHLGDVQIKAKKYEDAINTYNRDLEKYPKNGWAQHGLKLIYENLNDSIKVSEINELIAQSWATADVELKGSKVKNR